MNYRSVGSGSGKIHSIISHVAPLHCCLKIVVLPGIHGMLKYAVSRKPGMQCF